MREARGRVLDVLADGPTQRDDLAARAAALLAPEPVAFPTTNDLRVVEALEQLVAEGLVSTTGDAVHLSGDPVRTSTI